LNLSEFGIEFLLLALRIDKHIKGYVDFYFGPKNLRKIVDSESITSPKKLLLDSKTLLKQLRVQGYDKDRERYLEKMLTAMKTTIEILNGIEISIKDQFLRLYDVDLLPINESVLDNLKEEYNEAYRGLGSLERRMKNLRITRKVPEGKVFELFQKGLNITKKRTKELFVDLLPKNERVLVELVENNSNDEKIKWNCYNWYLGDYTSKIEVNPNYQMYWTAFLSFTSHEGYPGHHTEFVLKEKRLYRELNQFEHSVLIMHSPKLIISEGIATTAISMIFSNQEVAEISLREFCSDPSKEVSLEQIVEQNIVKEKIPLFWYNFAYHALIDQYSEEDLFRYGKDHEIFSDESIKTEIKILSNPAHSKNAFMYKLGSNIITNKFGEVPSVKNFRNLLVNPILPSDLR